MAAPAKSHTRSSKSIRIEQAAAEEPMACEIGRLPEEMLSAALARTSPRDACRAAAVSPAFRAAADSDAVWECFLPPPEHDKLLALADGELPPAPEGAPRNKDLFLRLSDGPVLLQDKLMSMWLDRENGARCYMLSARNLFIVWGYTPQYWTWIPITDSRFSEGAELIDVCWFEIRGKIPRKMLSQDTIYAAYIVFKLNAHVYGLDSPLQEASISVGETYLTRKVRFRPRKTLKRHGPAVSHGGEPQKRADGWMEVELGEFFNAGDDKDGEVSFSLTETKGGNWKSGLVVQGIEIRRKKSG